MSVERGDGDEGGGRKRVRELAALERQPVVVGSGKRGGREGDAHYMNPERIPT
jgi:hypothetical protein